MTQVKKELNMIQFKVYLHRSAYLSDTGVGNVVLLDKYGKESYGKVGNKPFSNFDEIPKAMRLLVRDVLKLKREFQDSKSWKLVPK